jgi:phosphatidylserine synthase 1
VGSYCGVIEVLGIGVDEMRRKPRSPILTPEVSSGDESGDLSTCSESWEETWSIINERKVSEISLNFFYMPRTLTLLSLILVSLVCVAFMRPARDGMYNRQSNAAAGICYSCFLFLSVGLLVFPNGPYTRPHPALWRLVFGLSFLYFLFLSFILFQNYSDVLLMLNWIDPHLNSTTSDSSKLYAVDCSFTGENLYSRLDIFILAHLVGWAFKALLVRHTVVLWTISIMWECTELFFAHVLPNFYECWWDAIIFDVLLCNGCGIYIGMVLCRKLEVRQFHWESIKKISGAKGKLKRAILQFTPQEWSKIRWLDPSSTYMRILAIFLLILIFQITELNTFLLKHIFDVPTNHYFNHARLLLLMLIGAPSVRQYYVYVTDNTSKRLGTQAWVYLGVMVTELLVSIRYGLTVLPRPALVFMLGWLSLTALFSIVMVLLNTRTRIMRKVQKGGVFNWIIGEDVSIPYM